MNKKVSVEKLKSENEELRRILKDSIEMILTEGSKFLSSSELSREEWNDMVKLVHQIKFDEFVNILKNYFRDCISEIDEEDINRIIGWAKAYYFHV